MKNREMYKDKIMKALKDAPVEDGAICDFMREAVFPTQNVNISKVLATPYRLTDLRHGMMEGQAKQRIGLSSIGSTANWWRMKMIAIKTGISY